MSDDPTKLESSLRHHTLAGLDASLLNRLEAAADGSLLELTTLEKQFEEELRRIKPATLTPTLLASLEKSANRIDFPTTATVVPFRKSTGRPHRTPNRSWWGAAASVAILGALAALMLPGKPGATGTVKADPPQQQLDPAVPSTNELIPAGFSRELHETTDEGIVWPAKNKPHRVIKVVYKDLVTLKRPDGSTYQVEQPRVEYFLVPTESD